MSLRARTLRDGAIIDYDLPQDAHGIVTLEVLDSAGNCCANTPAMTQLRRHRKELRTELIPAYWPLHRGPLPRTRACIAGSGICAAAAPTATHYDYPIAAVPHRTPLAPQGPLVVPGTYTVRLTVDGKSETAPLTVRWTRACTCRRSSLRRCTQLRQPWRLARCCRES